MPRPDVDVIASKELCGFTRCVGPCIVMLTNTRSIILHETINDRLCMNPVTPRLKMLLPRLLNDYIDEFRR